MKLPANECADLTDIVDHRTLIALAKILQAATCVGTPAPIVRRIADWCRAAPQPGDLVVEMSSYRMAADRVGLYERTEIKRLCYHETNDVNHPGCNEPDCVQWRNEDGCPEHFVWILVQREPERRCRWHNASFFRLPKNEAQWREAEGRDIPSSFDRGTLVDLLADSGIQIGTDA
jgi:hypothetical protein